MQILIPNSIINYFAFYLVETLKRKYDDTEDVASKIATFRLS